jgi:predicted tellurium resistance membrane protein TerC
MGWLASPDAWVALLTLTALEVVLGIDNIVFLSILSSKLPEHQQALARRLGLALALFARIALLFSLSWVIGLTAPLFTVFGQTVSGRDLILLGGGLFLIGKATIEIHHRVDPFARQAAHALDARVARYWPTVLQILLLDMVFSVDSILAAVALTREFWIIAAAIVVSVLAMLASMDRLARFLERNPTVVMLALAFLVMIGMVLVAEAFEVHVPKGFVYTAMAFSAGVEALNLLARRAAQRRHLAAGPSRTAAAPD